MITMSLEEKARTLVGQLPANKLAAVVQLLEVMVNDDEDESDELTPGDIQAIQEGERRVANGEPRVSFEELVADLGLTMERIRSAGEDASA